MLLGQINVVNYCVTGPNQGGEHVFPVARRAVNTNSPLLMILRSTSTQHPIILAGKDNTHNTQYIFFTSLHANILALISDSR